MTLHPEDNSLYWPLLLTDALYLLPEDLAQPKGSTERKTEATAVAPAAAISSNEITEALPQAQAQPNASAPEKAQADMLWGSLHKGILILVDYPDHALMERTDGLFLVDILKAVGFEFKEVATLNVRRCKTPADWQYVRNLACTWIISFGVEHPELPFTLQKPDYQKHTEEGKIILAAESLSLIRTDIGRKKLLWNLLRQAFV